ncbi:MULTISPECIES: lytic polysaccharide monooxygenase auxiliary activity family 9 protein [unclassified Streptomyces]|uniref:lytic polysaccharide monooxygenase auxiliary activity family 9 protein n=1 Tax=unclassified Streptomyces TaxID=2593676 RepID=UPI00081B9E32|nr:MULTISPECIES: lytic polysaccharide monooxygenase auxiliary activity family 9 protein [unclassified Streptomyces]MYQ82583.1 chitin-binding protein [Streptomyces sp. SID4936]SCD45533.1 chitin-binding protein [Streptomyces sp. DvalAA-43]
MQPSHGPTEFPPSRGRLHLMSWQADALEAGKFFPATEAGLPDPVVPSDVANAQPPADGKIASAGMGDAAALDEVGTDWKKHPVTAGQNLDVRWVLRHRQKTRRFNYFLTKQGWDPNQALSRSQFDTEPFHQVQLSEQPYWQDDLAPGDRPTHTMRLPQRDAGHHVLLAVQEIADTGNAFYRVIDLQYT